MQYTSLVDQYTVTLVGIRKNQNSFPLPAERKLTPVNVYVKNGCEIALRCTVVPEARPDRATRTLEGATAWASFNVQDYDLGRALGPPTLLYQRQQSPESAVREMTAGSCLLF